MTNWSTSSENEEASCSAGSSKSEDSSTKSPETMAETSLGDTGGKPGPMTNGEKPDVLVELKPGTEGKTSAEVNPGLTTPAPGNEDPNKYGVPESG